MEKNHVIQSYGRKRARGLSLSQKESLRDLYKVYGIELPKVLYNESFSKCSDSRIENRINPQSFFNNNFKNVIFEIGFGHGEHLINNAIQKVDYGLIGCEPFENGVANALKKISDNRLENIRIYNGDARFLLNLLMDDSICRFYVLFPDPWTKKKHYKRRLLSADFIKTMRRKLIAGGDVVIATDSESYVSYIVENMQKNPEIELFDVDFDYLSQKPSCFLSTRYEQKALSKGKRAYYLRFKK
jgi:tRNA (guanine-N7-)-methyltransferase